MKKNNGIVSYGVITLIMFLILTYFIVKAGMTMYVNHNYWIAVADRFKKENVVIPPMRGNILSADGKLMASSLPEYRVYIDFNAGTPSKDSLFLDSINYISKGLSNIFPDKSASYFKATLLAGLKAKSTRHQIYNRRITYIQYNQIKELPILKWNKYKGGLYEERFNQRKKPFGSLASRTLGDLFPDMEMGAKNGIELSFDSLLKGKSGIMHRQKMLNKVIDMVDIEPISGLDIVSTIDVEMQDVAEKALRDKLIEIDGNVGVAILMDVPTGDVKAIVSLTKVGENNYQEVKNNAISDMIEPGSTFKTVSMMVALEDKKIKITDNINTGNGVKMMHGRAMKDHNWNRGGYQVLSVPKILWFSSNIGISTIIDDGYGSNPTKFVEGIHKIGLNRRLNLQIEGEGTPNIKLPKANKYWSKTSLPWMAIGYETQIPPLNMLTFYNAIANNGVMVKPRFVKAAMREGVVVKEFPVEVINPAICSSKTLKEIQNILTEVVSKGLAKPAGSILFQTAGKTGTAQISKGKAGYKSGEMEYLVSFAGYYPAEAPKYSCIITIRKSKLPASGGGMAGPVFSKIAEGVMAKSIHTNVKMAIDSVHTKPPLVKRGTNKDATFVLANLHINKSLLEQRKEMAREEGDTLNPASTKSVMAKNRVPDVNGLCAKDAVYLLEKQGLKVSIKGRGRVFSQTPSAGSLLVTESKIVLTLD